MKKSLLKGLRIWIGMAVPLGIVAVNVVVFLPLFQNLPQQINYGSFSLSKGCLSHIWLGQVLGIGVLLALKILPKGGLK